MGAPNQKVYDLREATSKRKGDQCCQRILSVGAGRLLGPAHLLQESDYHDAPFPQPYTPLCRHHFTFSQLKYEQKRQKQKSTLSYFHFLKSAKCFQTVCVRVCVGHL